jgi:hypothetical protein
MDECTIVVVLRDRFSTTTGCLESLVRNTMDITEGGKWPEFLVFLNSKLGLFPRMFPNALGICLDRAYQGLRAVLALPVKLMRSARAHVLQRGAWDDEPTSGDMAKRRNTIDG